MEHPNHTPPPQGLYDPRHEHDACGIGFIADVKGRKSHRTVEMALEALVHLDHRGARGCEDNTGDGAGVLLQIPHNFLMESCEGLGINLPEPGHYGVGMVFTTDSRLRRSHVTKIFEQIVAEEGQRLLGWRKVPTDNFHLGPTSRTAEPFVNQILIGRSPDLADSLAFERKLYTIRKRASNAVHYAGADELFYIPSLSSRTIVYKGMLTPGQVKEFYPDLSDPRMETAIAMFHSRFSTNTFPTWERSHPFRYIIHNGEINTLRGNRNWMKTREAMLTSEHFGPDLAKLLPVLTEGGSDSSSFDDCLELLTLSGRSMPHAVMMMIPEPWENHESMDADRRAFYEYHNCLMEPWDGPASIAFTDGTVVGACLDRNGFRPSRYYVTKDDLVVLASETGVVDIPPEDVAFKGRLQPGRMLLIDTHEGRIIEDEEVKQRIASNHPYREWLDEHLLPIEDLPAPEPIEPDADHANILQLQQAFGYTFEEQRVFLGPMTRAGRDPVGSMGNDAALAVLSDRPRLLYDYFKQLFAQVTNPPVDPYKEAIITSSRITIGPERNLLEPEPESCRQIRLQTPILSDEELVQLRRVDRPGLKAITIPILFRAADGECGLSTALDGLFESADLAIHDGHTILVLSDRGVDRANAPIPALLAVAGLHHHLIRHGTRTRVGIVLESGEPRTVHHFSALIGYGAQAVNPYMAFAGIADMIHEGMLSDITYPDATKGYIRSATNGLVKVMAKMGISTVRSYCGAQIFEAEGLKREFVDRYFTWTDSRVEGVGIDTIAQESVIRHTHAYPETQSNGKTLAPGGHYQWRKDGEYHLFDPQTVHKLQKAVRTNDYEIYREYADRVNDQSTGLATLRGLLDFRHTEEPVPLEQVDSVEEICRRFKTGAMSYGSISQEAHESLAIAMNRIGGKSNTGEGGEDPARYIPMPNGDSKNSAIKQVASGRFGVTSEYLVNARELQIKMAQGAKPGEGGELPGHKVYPWIARVRHATPGVELISPPPHHDIYSIEDLAQLIHDLKNANDRARISVKLVSEVGVGTIAAGVAKGHADVILISGHDGGTGASPQTSIKHSGMPWELGVAETHQTLVLNNLRGRVVVETDGQLKTGRDVVIAALLGAEEFGFASTVLVAMGCVMMRVCHLDTCPVGVATQNPDLRKRFMGGPEHVQSFLRFIAQDVREIMAALGFRTLNEMVGRSDRLAARSDVDHWKAKGLDLSRILHQPKVDPQVSRYCQFPQDHGLENAIDNQVLMDLCEPALERGERVKAVLPIKNTNRVVGTILGSEITRRYGAEGLPDDTIDIKFQGSAGQSFAAFTPRGLTFRLEGDANDYFGKGLSGARLIVYPPEGATFVPRDNIIIGNVSFYGATSGEAYIRGMAGERFCVRNSGAHAVVEAVGDHGCEYMTGGRVVVLGPTGRNFAAGMSGGVAYVLDENGDFHIRCNTEMSDLEPLADQDPSEIEEVKALIERHANCTASALAWEILDDWDAKSARFCKVMPRDYRRVLEAVREAREEGLEGDDAWLHAFRSSIADGEAAHAPF